MLGNVTRDVVLTYTPNQTAVVDLGLAVNRSWTANGEKHEATCFIDVRAYGAMAGNVNKYVNKGDLLMVCGHLDYETWEKDGARRSKHRLVAQRVQFMPSGNSSGESG